MITMQTAMGAEREVDPNTITIITGPGPKDKHPGARVIGAALAPIKATMSADDFVATLPNKENFVKLAFARNGNGFWINAKTIHAMRHANDSDLVKVPNAATQITFGKGKHRFVTTDMDTVRSMVNAAGGNV